MKIARFRPPHPSVCKPRLRVVLTRNSRDDHDGQRSGPDMLSSDEWQLRSRRKVRSEVVSAGARIGLQAAVVEQQLEMFHSLLPNLPISLEQMRASDWARVVADPDLAAKVVLLKVAFPSLNVEVLLGKHPRVLLWSRQRIQENIEQISPVFQSLPRPEAVLEVLPELLDPKQCFSVVATLRKWYPKRDPLEVLQADPDVVRRAEAWDVPLEPVFFDAATGTWTAAGYSRTKQEDWQVYIEQQIYKRKPQPIDKQETVVVGGAAAAAAATAAAATAFAAAAAAAAAGGEAGGDLLAAAGKDGDGGAVAAPTLTGDSAFSNEGQVAAVAAAAATGPPTVTLDRPAPQL